MPTHSDKWSQHANTFRQVESTCQHIQTTWHIETTDRLQNTSHNVLIIFSECSENGCLAFGELFCLLRFFHRRRIRCIPCPIYIYCKLSK